MKRPANPIPDHIAKLLRAEGLRELYDQRPWYQRNDYIGWICSAKREETRRKRTYQMLEELRAGDVYMKMAWRAKS
ncbi:MAG: hypothetical protein ACJA06_001448 [Halocynthiibacter sp.]|jgi:uncharacterized protein YdeI (YjbR/CyaY-like superfamily)